MAGLEDFKVLKIFKGFEVTRKVMRERESSKDHKVLLSASSPSSVDGDTAIQKYVERQL